MEGHIVRCLVTGKQARRKEIVQTGIIVIRASHGGRYAEADRQLFNRGGINFRVDGVAGGIGHLNGLVFADGIALGHREGVIGIIAAVPRVLELSLERHFHAVGSAVGIIGVSGIGIRPGAYAHGADFIVDTGPEARHGSIMAVRQTLFHPQIAAQGLGHIQIRVANITIIGRILLKIGGRAETGTHGTENTGGGILARHFPGIGITPRKMIVPDGIMFQAQGHAGVKAVRG